MIKKLFISQPMRGKSEEYIKHEREAMIAKATEEAKKKYGENTKVEIIDSYFENYDGNAVGFLSKSIGKLSEADLAAFAPDWGSARGCKIEHTICEEYEIEIILD